MSMQLQLKGQIWPCACFPESMATTIPIPYPDPALPPPDPDPREPVVPHQPDPEVPIDPGQPIDPGEPIEPALPLRKMRLLVAIFFVVSTIFAAAADQQKPRGNPAERGEPTVSDQQHPEQPAADKPADGVAPKGGKLQGLDTPRWSWLRDGLLAIVAIPAAIAFLVFIFSRLSTSPSRDPSRNPKI